MLIYSPALVSDMEHINNKCILRHEENMKILMLHRHARMVQAIVRQAAQWQKCSVSHTPTMRSDAFQGMQNKTFCFPHIPAQKREKTPEPRLSGNQEERGTTARTSATPSRTQKRMSYPANGMPYTLSGSV